MIDSDEITKRINRLTDLAEEKSRVTKDVRLLKRIKKSLGKGIEATKRKLNDEKTIKILDNEIEKLRRIYG